MKTLTGISPSSQPEAVALVKAIDHLVRAVEICTDITAQNREALRRAHHFLEDAIEATGCDEDDLVSEETENVWVRIICARDVLKSALKASL